MYITHESFINGLRGGGGNSTSSIGNKDGL